MVAFRNNVLLKSTIGSYTSSMVRKLHAEINKVYFINNHSLIHILSGSGEIQVDFNNYYNWQDKVIYLEKGQYIKFLSDDFTVRIIEFPDEIMFRSKDVRVLFKHLISLGYIDYKNCSDCENLLNQNQFNSESSKLIDISTEQWYWQNPFHANKEEYQIIFDIKDVIDTNYCDKLTNDDVVQLINSTGLNAHAVLKNKVGLSIKSMLNNKKILESKKEIAFTDKSIKEVAYSHGFNDPAYFNKVFTSKTGQNPLEFRSNFDIEKTDTFVEDILELIKNHHAEEHNLEFYADKMNLSKKALSKKVKLKMQTSLGRLIRNKIIDTSCKLLSKDIPIREIAFQMGFEEPNHFSSFFKHYTGETPSQSILQKVQ